MAKGMLVDFPGSNSASCAAILRLASQTPTWLTVAARRKPDLNQRGQGSWSWLNPFRPEVQQFITN